MHYALLYKVRCNFLEDQFVLVDFRCQHLEKCAKVNNDKLSPESDKIKFIIIFISI